MVFIKDYIGFETEYIKVIRKSDDNVQIEKNKDKKYKNIFWLCLCKQCNREFNSYPQIFRKTKSCGCSKSNRTDNKKYFLGYTGKTKSGLEYEVIEREKELVTIRFVNTGYVVKVKSASLSQGFVKDKLQPSVCGVGYLGYCDKPNRSQEYKLWNGIIQRCYNPKRQDYQMYGLKGITVCERWKCFAYFLEDIEKIEGYNKEKFLNGHLDLDKDIKQTGVPMNKKIYSIETCVFIDKHINRSITKREPTQNISITSIKDGYILETNCPVEELAKQINVKTQYITRILRGEAKSHDGWTFQYS